MSASTEVQGNNLDLSFLDDILVPQKPVEEIDPNAPKYIIFQQQVDGHTIKRTRNLITPAVCLECGLDLLKLAFEQNKVETNVFDALPEEIKLLFPQLVLKHTKLAHNKAERLIVSATEKPKHWLSGRDLK